MFLTQTWGQGYFSSLPLLHLLFFFPFPSLLFVLLLPSSLTSLPIPCHFGLPSIFSCDCNPNSCYWSPPVDSRHLLCSKPGVYQRFTTRLVDCFQVFRFHHVTDKLLQKILFSPATSLLFQWLLVSGSRVLIFGCWLVNAAPAWEIYTCLHHCVRSRLRQRYVPNMCPCLFYTLNVYFTMFDTVLWGLCINCFIIPQCRWQL